LVEHHERQRNAELDSAFVRTGFNAGITMPALIFVSDNGNFTLTRTAENIARTGISAKAATFTLILVDYRRHILTSVNSEQ
jgi:hypothetical protein